MNKMRRIGLVVLIIGIISQFALEEATYDFWSGALIGGGIALLFFGKMVKLPHK
jgi:hypothetical protein